MVIMLILVMCHAYRHGEEKQVRIHFLSEWIEFEERLDRTREFRFLTSLTRLESASSSEEGRVSL